MFKKANSRTNSENVREFEQLIELKNFKVSEKPLNELERPLLNKKGLKNLQQEDPSLWYRLTKRFRKAEVSMEPRFIHFDGKVVPPNSFANIVKNQKYNPFTFIFVVLYNQFKFFFNLFFLVIALSQFVEPLKVGFLFTYVGPLAFVLIMSMAKEAFDDYKRYKRDVEANSQKYKVLKGNNSSEMVMSSNLKVGDIIQVEANQRVPADLVLLHTNDPSETIFIRTDQLDGETDWKLRKPIRYTQALGAEHKKIQGIRASVEAEPPSKLIYNFIGLFKIEVPGESYKESLSLENTLWANTVLASSTIIALVAYTGKETRMAMNSKKPRSKVGELDMELNELSKQLFVFMMGVSAIILFLRGFTEDWIIIYFKYVLLVSSIIPISLRVNLDFAKACFSYKINTDKEIEGSIARNSTIPEELGRVECFLTDKTGTLTQNDMIFKKLCLETIQYTENDMGIMKRILKKQCQRSQGPAWDVEQRILKEDQSKNTIGLLSAGGVKKRRGFKRDKELVLRDLVSALALCHNVTPVVENGQKEFQASSPDEVALVKTASKLKMKLLERTQTKMSIKNAAGLVENYEILANFPFSSESKRMGIILKHVETQRIMFYLKGADTVMKYKIAEYQRGFLQDEVDELAKIGLRTLIITQKYLTPKEYEEWNIQYEEANNQTENREAQVRKVVEMLEGEMEFLGITGVEDKLQEEVAPTIETLREAGISVWMLTGDKVETALCIAISAGFKSPKQEIYIMRDLTDPYQIQTQLAAFNNKINAVLIIDGTTLQYALEHHKKYFFDVASKAPAIVCCRVSPTQKAEVTTGIKEFTGKKTLSIGDGGNDVGMIQAADVGVGIVGKEGKQAALAADFSILKFKYVKTLLLWHGRNAYKRTAVMAQFVIHRGLVISVIQAIFSIMFYYVAIPVYNGMLMLGYATIYTSFPVFCLIFDHDVTKKVALNYAPLYRTLQKGRELNTKTFFIWIWKSIYQASMIMILSIYLFNDSYLEITTITFSALIVAELLNVYTEVTKLHIVMIISQIMTIGIYVGSLFYFREYINVSRIDLDFATKVGIITAVSWIPLHIGKLLFRRFNPSDDQKIMKRAKVMDAVTAQNAPKLEKKK